jgi:2,3-bisphosphoglycerate-independent phosphoglycerate mutase
MSKKITALIIMDGYGLSDEINGNAIGPNCSPYIRYLMETYPSVRIQASGEAVGLPEGQMGNSEVGHLNIGAGRIVYQDLTRISKSIKDGDFFQNEVLLNACKAAENSKLHLMGLVSDGGVHSHMEHIYALLRLAKQEGLQEVYVHCFTDGRDTPPDSGVNYVAELQKAMDEIGVGKIASLCGRYYAMDRDKRWDRVEKAYDMLVLGKGNTAKNAVDALKASYAAGITDEFVLPTCIIDETGKPVATVSNGDSIIFFNFRPDRAREMTRAFTDQSFDAFDLKGKQRKVTYTQMTKYDESFDLPIAFLEISIKNTLGEYLAQQGIVQLRAAETEKYAHVTFFFNGGVEHPNKNEHRLLIDSPKIATYDLQPEMSALILTDRVIAELQKEKYDVLILNYANCDMVGHTGVFEAAKKAVETVDNCVRRIVEQVLLNGGVAFVTADHGNAERMIEDGKPFTAHTSNLVPFIMVSENHRDKKLREGGALCDIAPTMLDVMGLEQPKEMKGKSLIAR